MRFLPILLLALACGIADARGLVIGRPAPALEATFTDGHAWSLADQRGKVVIVNFWATWCGPCRAEMPALDAFYRAHREEGLEVVGIDLDEPENAAEAAEVMSAFAYPSASIRDTHAGGYGRPWRLPLSFVIDRDGNLVRDGFKAAPVLDAAELETLVSPLLRTGTAPPATR